MYIYTTDWHLSTSQPINRLGNVLEDSMAKVEQVFKLAKETNSVIIHGGDLFAKPQIEYNLLNRLISLMNQYSIVMYGVIGNHDVLGANTDYERTAIHVLRNTGLYRDVKELSDDNITFYSIDYTKCLTEINNIPETDKFSVVVSHLPVTPEACKFEHIKIADITSKAKLYLCGHIHNPYIIKDSDRVFANPGCLVRRSKAEKNIIPSVILFDTTKLEIIAIPAGNVQFAENAEIEQTIQNITDISLEDKDIETYLTNNVEDPDVLQECLSRIKKVGDAYGL